MINDRPGLHERELAFFGKISAHISHDIRNVLAIIGEYSGLMDDLLKGADSGKPIDRDRFIKLISKITAKIENGTSLMKRFSRFAHSADERVASADLVELVGNIAALANRQVTMAGCRLQSDIPAVAIPVRTALFPLQHAVFTAIQLLMDLSGKDSTITVKLHAGGSDVNISISTDKNVQQEIECNITSVSDIINMLNGAVQVVPDKGGLSILISIPRG